jgi:hypothetical protein
MGNLVALLTAAGCAVAFGEGRFVGLAQAGCVTRAAGSLQFGEEWPGESFLSRTANFGQKGRLLERSFAAESRTALAVQTVRLSAAGQGGAPPSFAVAPVSSGRIDHPGQSRPWCCIGSGFTGRHVRRPWAGQWRAGTRTRAGLSLKVSVKLSSWLSGRHKKGRASDLFADIARTGSQRWRALKRGLLLQITNTLPRRRTILQSRCRALADFRELSTFTASSRH